MSVPLKGSSGLASRSGVVLFGRVVFVARITTGAVEPGEEVLRIRRTVLRAKNVRGR